VSLIDNHHVELTGESWFVWPWQQFPKESQRTLSLEEVDARD
jgi:hypothetical protein